ncbi:MAG: hypothetical protein FWF69_08760 [Firmicutes bacterium]|nr:hypothetical protein [Bacillota bacterium]
MKKTFLIWIPLLTLLTACSSLDVVQKDAVRAFGDVMEVLAAEEYAPNRWSLTAPDETAWFFFDNRSVGMAVDAAPFVAAGADLSKLENAGEHTINPGKDSMYFSSPGFDMPNQNVKDSAIDQFAVNVGALRKYVGYHAEMDHYNIDLNGAMFEWAKDITTNDKDIVFVLNPEPLIAAGVDPENVDGWLYAQVPVMQDGKEVQVYKFLKPVTLK